VIAEYALRSFRPASVEGSRRDSDVLLLQRRGSRRRVRGRRDEAQSIRLRPRLALSSAPLFQQAGSNHYWYHNDHLGTPQEMLDQSGNVVWAGTYDSFGTCQVAVADVANNFRFPLAILGCRDGLLYNWNRYYDPGTGRYLQREPFELSFNSYGYAAANPLVYVDPDARCVLASSFIPGFGELMDLVTLFDPNAPWYDRFWRVLPSGIAFLLLVLDLITALCAERARDLRSRPPARR